MATVRSGGQLERVGLTGMGLGSGEEGRTGTGGRSRVRGHKWAEECWDPEPGVALTR